MNKLLLLFIGLWFMLSFTSCEEEDSPLLFEVVNVSDPQDVKMEYYSPAPSCMAKMYWITTNTNECELTIKCTNAGSVSVVNQYGKFVKECKNKESEWTAKVIDPITIRLTFNKLDDLEEHGSIRSYLTVVYTTKNGEITAQLSIDRYNSHLDF